MNFGAAEGYVPSPSVQQAKVGKNLGEVSYSPVSVQRNTRKQSKHVTAQKFRSENDVGVFWFLSDVEDCMLIRFIHSIDGY